MDTSSTVALKTALRAHLLAFSHNGATLSGTIGTRLYQEQAPDDATYPFGVMRLVGLRALGAYNGDRYTGELEVLLYARSSAQRQAIERAGDIVQAAFLRYADATTAPHPGLVFSRERQRDALPLFTAPADAELLGERHLISLVIWPQFITQYRDT